MELNLKNKKILITGASQGIGAGLAEDFAREGCRLHLVARSAHKLESLATKIREDYGTEVTIQPLDLTAPGTIAAVVAAADDIDVLVNNAGTIPSGSLWDVDEAAWRAGWDLKVFGYINLVRAYYPLMKARGGGVIINNIGNSGEVFDPLYVAGTTGNAALMAFTKAMGGDSLKDGIRVVGVNPGPVATERIYNMLKKRAASNLGDADRYTELEKTYPLGRPAHVSEVSQVIVFLASEHGGYTSGTIITVDGGITSRRSII